MEVREAEGQLQEIQGRCRVLEDRLREANEQV